MSYITCDGIVIDEQVCHCRPEGSFFGAVILKNKDFEIPVPGAYISNSIVIIAGKIKGKGVYPTKYLHIESRFN